MGDRDEEAVVVQIDRQRNRRNIAGSDCPRVHRRRGNHPPKQPAGRQTREQQPTVHTHLLRIPELKAVGRHQQCANDAHCLGGIPARGAYGEVGRKPEDERHGQDTGPEGEVAQPEVLAAGQPYPAGEQHKIARHMFDRHLRQHPPQRQRTPQQADAFVTPEALSIEPVGAQKKGQQADGKHGDPQRLEPRNHVCLRRSV